jgi:hypothetical protein
VLLEIGSGLGIPGVRDHRVEHLKDTFFHRVRFLNVVDQLLPQGLRHLVPPQLRAMGLPKNRLHSHLICRSQ